MGRDTVRVQPWLLHASASENMPCMQRLVYLSTLKDGWHFGSGRAPVVGAVQHAIMVMFALRSAGAACIEVFPDVDGGIMVAGYHAEQTIEVVCRHDGYFEFVLEVDQGDVVLLDRLSLSSALSLVRAHGWAAQISFDSSPPSITATRSAGSPAKRSRTHPLAAFQSSTLAA